MNRLLIIALALLVVACASTSTKDQVFSKYTLNGVRNNYSGKCFEIWRSPRNDSLLIRECVDGSKVTSSLAEGLISGLSLGLVNPDLGATAMTFVAAGRNYLGDKCRVLGQLKVDDGMGGTAAYEIMYQC